MKSFEDYGVTMVDLYEAIVRQMKDGFSETCAQVKEWEERRK